MEKIVVRLKRIGGRNTYVPISSSAKMMAELSFRDNLSERMVEILRLNDIAVFIEDVEKNPEIIRRKRRRVE